ncbi:NACHT domain-containing protein [Trichoderma breve]|uniref:NACHT domain-containing protein n=1 Tax=Trichoderma breve TaxID=2034170 RepID=A0A9W9B396_9HYPO|nr:NACHT domain-containing protein [Trichoderma breve]KAJ4855087.1 NACHT domain-containing protein [Trichoderma breve]
MPRKSISTFFKGLRSKSHGRNDPAGSSLNVLDHGETERGQSLQLIRHSILPQPGRSTSTTPQPSTLVILSNKLHDSNSDHPQSGNETNTIATAGDERRAQMLAIMQYGQNRVKREVKIKESVREAMEIVNSMKSIISTGIQAAPQAALPWSIVSMALDIVQNPVKAQKDNIEGIAYTTKRMKWYWSLSSDLFHGDGCLRNNNGATDTQNGILLRLVGLYKEIILFQVKSIYNWNDSLKEIRTLELEFQNDYATYMTLEEKINNLEQQDRDCLRDLYITNPRNDKERLLDTKGGLLPDSYTWAVKSAMFRQWHTEKETNLLWIKGNPGKGKTMMICGLIEELEHMEPHQDLLSYFFCQGTDPNFNNATAVLRGIIYSLATQKPSLIEHVQQAYKNVGSRSLFDGINAWITLSGVFVKMLQDPALENACLIVDALDECESDRKKLLDLIVGSTLATPQVKWILSSRNYPDIEAKIRSCRTIAVIDLESSATLVSESVDAYIRCRTRQLSLIEDNEVLQEQLQRAILQKSSGTFLWAALVFQEIEERRTYDDDAELLQLLDAMPSGLSGLYERMMNQINLLVRSDQERCRNILATMVAAYQPLNLETLPIMAGLKGRLTQAEPLKLLVRMCGSFLTIRGDVVYFVHQSAKDYLIGEGRNRILPSGSETIHRDMFNRSLEAMSKPGKLRPNIYSLPYPGVKIHEISLPQPDPLASIMYCCMHWLQHFCDGVNKIFDFLKLHFLHWIEALSLSQNLEAGVVSLQNLINLLTVYISAIIFAPMKSYIRLHFKDAISWIKTLPQVENNWSPCQYTLYCGQMTDAVFSNDTSQLITLSPDGKVKIWESTTGKLIPDLGSEFEGPPHYMHPNWFTLSNDAKLLAILDLPTITVWDVESGKQVQEFKAPRYTYHFKAFTAFSLDCMFLAVTHDTFFQIWELATRKMVHETLHQEHLSQVILSQDFKLAAWETTDSILISNVATGEKIYELSSKFQPIRFSNNSSYLVATDCRSPYRETSLQVWPISSGEEIIRHTSRGPLEVFRSIAFSDDSKFLAFGQSGGNINIWNLEEKAMIQSYIGHIDAVSSIAFSRDARLLVSGSMDRTVKVWKTDFDSIDRQPQSELDKTYSKINAVTLSTDGELTATLSGEKIRFWSTQQSPHIQTIWQSKNLITESFNYLRATTLAISKDSRLVVSVHIFREDTDDPLSIGMSIWSIDLDSPATDTFQVEDDSEIVAVAFSPNAEFLAAAYHAVYYGEKRCTVIIWKVESRERVYQRAVSTTVPAATRFFVDDAYLYVVTDIECYRLKEPTGNLPEHGDRYLIPADKVDIGYSINSSKDWIAWNGKDMIWLPGDFRPSSTGAFSARIAEVALATALGSLITMNFEEPPSEDEDWTPWKSSGFL